MKTTVKTIAIATIIAFGTASAFAKPANGNSKTTQSKVVTTTTVKTTTTTTTTVKEEPKKVAAKPQPKPVQKNKVSHKKNNNIKHVAKAASKPTVVVKKESPKPVTVVKKVEVKPAAVQIDNKALAAGAIVGGIIALTAIAAAN